MTIITPLTRPQNLPSILDSMDFRFIEEWLIVVDANTPPFDQHLYQNHPGIRILHCPTLSELGSHKRNVAMDSIQNKNTFLYFLDDDNIIHPDIYNVLATISHNVSRFYTFNQIQKSLQLRLLGDRIERYHIDTAMFLVHYGCCETIRWNPDLSEGDGIFIEDVYAKHPDAHVYLKHKNCYYNYLAG